MALVTAIEFTDLSCRIVQAERTRNKTSLKLLEGFALERVEDAAARVDQRAQLLRDFLKQHKIKAQRVTVILPKSYVMARIVTLPSTVDEELVGMARFEAERHIPFNAERHIVAHQVLSKLGVEGSRVLLTAVDQPIAQEYVDICAKAGLLVESLGVSSLALFNGFAFANHGALTEKVVAIVNIGSAFTDIVIIHNGMLAFSRASSLGVGKLLSDLSQANPPWNLATDELNKIDAIEPHRSVASAGEVAAVPVYPEIGNTPAPFALDSEQSSTSLQAITTAAPAATEQAATPPDARRQAVTSWLLNLLKEIKRSYEFARREFNCPLIDHFYLSGEGAQLHNLPQFFKVNFGIEADTYNPLAGFDMPSKMSENLRGREAAFATVVGAVAPDVTESIKVNLLPAAYTEKREAKRQQQSYIVTGVLALVVLVLAYLYVADLFAGMEQKIEDYRTKNEEMSTRVADLQDKQTRLRIIRRYIQDEHGALEILEKGSTFNFIPDRVTLTRFEYNKDQTVKFEGHAKTIADVNKMETELKNLKIFESVVQDTGSNREASLPGRPDKVLGYSITANFPKKEIRPKRSSSSTADEEEEI